MLLASVAGTAGLQASANFTNLVYFTYTNAPNYGWNFQLYTLRTGA